METREDDGDLLAAENRKPEASQTERFDQTPSGIVCPLAQKPLASVADAANGQVVILPRALHNISRRDIDPDALKVLYHLSRHGYIAYLVGGSVRDLLMGRRPKDFDVGTDAHPRTIKKLFRNCFLVGRRFRLAHIKFGDKVIETSTFRRQPESSGGNDEEFFHRYDNTFGTPEEDARRRDFTVNGLFYDIRSFSVIDYVGGLRDLEWKIVRSIGDPDIRFREDPVRMLRAVRFASRLKFKIDPETFAAIKRHHAEIVKASPARLLEEVTRLFAYGSGEAAFRLLKETQLLSVLFPDLERFLNSDIHDGAVFWRHLAALDQYGGPPEGPAMPVIFATLLYPLFIKARKASGASQGQILDRELIDSLLRPIALCYRMPKRVQYRVVHTVAAQRIFTMGNDRHRMLNLIYQDYFQDALTLRRIHLTATGGDLSTLEKWRQLEAEIAARRVGMEGGQRRRPGRRRRWPRRRHSGGVRFGQTGGQQG